MKTVELERLVEIRHTGTIFLGNRDHLAQLQTEFARDNYIRLRGLLPPDLLEELHLSIERAQWSERIHKKIGVEICLEDPGLVGLVNFIFNDQRLFEIFQQITGCGPIGSFGGRIYRMAPNAGHYDSWHTDMAHHRLLALSLNLGKQPYEGGVLQIRAQGSGPPIVEIANTGYGDAILFRIASNLAHRVTNVVGDVTKTAFAGWFQAQPDFWSSIATRLPANER